MKSIVNMKPVLLMVLLLVAITIVACNGDDDVPATEVRVITNTPTIENSGGDTQLQATVDAMVNNQENLQATIDAQETRISEMATQEAMAEQSETEEVAVVPTDAPTVAATSEPRPSPTPTVPAGIFPTPRVEQASVVEQVFENGRMFWFRDRQIVWVAVGDEVDPIRGEWLCFEDSFVEGDVEALPEFDPPADVTTDSSFTNANPQQPIRGFGKIWRDNEELREQIGWALAPEVEVNTRREYIAGGLVDENDEYVAGPGEWRIYSFYNQQTFTFLEEELGMSCPAGTWRSRSNTN